MSNEFVLHHAVTALYLVMWLSLPAILVVTTIGLVIGIMQALTQIQDPTLPFAVKLIGVIVALILSATWLGAQLYTFGLQMFTEFPFLTR